MATKTKTEFQNAIQALITRGDLNLEHRKMIHYPMHFTKEFENRHIVELTEDTRTLNALRRFGCESFKDVIENWDEICRVRNMGAKSVAIAHNSLLDKYYQSLDVDGKAKFLEEIIKLNNKPVEELEEVEV